MPLISSVAAFQSRLGNLHEAGAIDINVAALICFAGESVVNSSPCMASWKSELTSPHNSPKYLE